MDEERYVKLTIKVRRPHSEPDKYEIEIPANRRQDFMDFINSWNCKSIEVITSLGDY